MDPERWRRIADLFNAVVELDADARRAHLAAVAEDNPSLVAEVEAMVAAHLAAGDLLIEDRLLSGLRPVEGLAPLPAGTVLGSYALEDLVGEGGMGEVYRAERVDGEYRQTVALKLLRPGFHSADAVRRFRRERNLLARLTHPDIVPILDGGTAPDGRPFLVMQFVEGVPITAYCRAHALGLEDRLRLFRRVADAVHFAHGRLVVHRDLKPSNILVQPDGAPRLLDFGIARLLEGADDGSSDPLTRGEFRVLTPEHAAPEQLRGEPVGTATDIYGLGVLLFELLTERRPFPSAGRSSEAFTRAVLTEPVPFPSAVAEGMLPRQRLRGDLDLMVSMALRKEPDRRYSSAAEFSDDVGRFLDGRPVRAQRDTRSYRLRRFVGRNRGGVAAAVLVTLLLAGFAASSAAQARRIARERDRAEAERSAAEDVLGVLMSLFQQSNPRLFPGGDTLPVAALVDEAEARLETLSDQPERQFVLWRAVGQLRTARGEHQRARELLARAWEAHGDREELPARDRANLYHEWAMAVLAVAGPDSARAMLSRSLETHRALLGDDHPDVVVALGDLASAEPDPEIRSRLLSEAREIQERLGVDTGVELALQLNQEGTSLFREGRTAEALARFEGALDVLETLFPPEHPNRLAVAANVAASLTGLARWGEAGTILEEIWELAGVAAPPGQRAGAMELMALNLAHQGRMPEAEYHLRRSLELARDSAGSRLPNTYRNLGALLGLVGRPGEGIALLDTALVLQATRGDADPAETEVMRVQRALLRSDLGDAEGALSDALESAAEVRRLVPPANARLGEVELWTGITALQAGRPDLAQDHFAASLSATRASHPPGHPAIHGAACGLSVAAREASAPVAESGSPDEDCRAYGAWGLAHPGLLAAAGIVPGSVGSR